MEDGTSVSGFAVNMYYNRTAYPANFRRRSSELTLNYQVNRFLKSGE